MPARELAVQAVKPVLTAIVSARAVRLTIKVFVKCRIVPMAVSLVRAAKPVRIKFVPARAVRLTIKVLVKLRTVLTVGLPAAAAKLARIRPASARVINLTSTAVNVLSVQQTRIAQAVKPAKAVAVLARAARV